MSFGKCSFILSFLLLTVKFWDGSSTEARYDHYRLYAVTIRSQAQLEFLQELEAKSENYMFYIRPMFVDRMTAFVVVAHKIPEMEDIIERFGLEATLMIENIQENIDRERPTIRKPTTSGMLMGWNNYYYLSTIYDWMELIARRHSFVEIFELGRTWEGRPIKGIKISKRPGNTEVFVEGGIHGLELITPATTTYIISQLIYSNDTKVQEIANNFDWYIIPVANPDGYEHCLKHDRLWRKNRRPFGRTRGADINANFDIDFGGIGSNMDPNSRDFPGNYPFSEPETVAIANFIKGRKNLRTLISIHSYSQLLLFPFGFTTEKIHNYDDLMHIVTKAGETIRQTHGKVYQVGKRIHTIYPTSGGLADWSATKGVQIPITFELRPSQESSDFFMLPADQIIPTSEETLAALVTILEEAGKLGYYD